VRFVSWARTRPLGLDIGLKEGEAAGNTSSSLFSDYFFVLLVLLTPAA